MNFINQNFYGFIFINSVILISIIINKLFLLNGIIVSSTFLCIFIGLVINNFFKINDKITIFSNFSLKTILKIGIALLGISLSIKEIVNFGSTSIFLIILNILIIFIVIFFLCVYFKIPKNLGYLITMGTCICGVTAIIATSSIIKSKKDEVSYAVGIVALFGMIAVLLYPHLANFLFGNNPILAGVFLGTSIHDTSQVTAASLIYIEIFNNEIVFNSAMTTKLLRNSFLIILIPIITYLYYSKQKHVSKTSFKSFFPLFVIGFILLSMLRTIGDQVLTNTDYFSYWELTIDLIKNFAKYLILISMTALGLQTNIKEVLKLGCMPIIIGFIASILVGIISISFLTMMV